MGECPREMNWVNRGRNYFGLFLCTWELPLTLAGTSLTSLSALKGFSLFRLANSCGCIPGNGTWEGPGETRMSCTDFHGERPQPRAGANCWTSEVWELESLPISQAHWGTTERAPCAQSRGSHSYKAGGKWGPKFNHGKSIKTKRT